MDELKRLEVQAWLVKAQHDLESGEWLSKKTVPLLDTGIYHFQQAAEKAIKAFLVYNDLRPPKTHDLAVPIVIAGGFTPNYLPLAGGRSSVD